VIIEACCTLATQHAQGYINTLLRGYSLNNGIETIIQALTAGYHGKAKEALIAALRDLYFHFNELKAVDTRSAR
jgi:hypothetical protein